MSDEKIQITLPKFEKKPRKAWPFALLAVFLAGLGGAAFYYWPSQITDDAARLESGIMPLAAGTSGRIAEVPVRLGDTVQVGQPVARLDTVALQTQLDEARARLSVTTPGAASAASSRAAEQSLLANMERSRDLERQAMREVEHFSTAHAQALLAVRKLDLQKARESVRSDARLKETEARVALDAARAEHAAQSRARAAADADLKRFRDDMTILSRSNLSDEAKDQVREILAARAREAEMALLAATVSAPGEGRIISLSVKPGSYVQTGQIVAEIEPVRPLVLAHATGADAARLAVGQTASVTFSSTNKLAPSAGKVLEIYPQDEHGQIPVRVELDGPLPEILPAGTPAKVVFKPALFW